jgi:hypothetical protein
MRCSERRRAVAERESLDHQLPREDFEMQVSNYFVLSDNNLILEDGDIKRFTKEMPPSSQFVKAIAHPILSFNIHPLTSGRLKFIVLLNNLADPSIPDDKIVFVYDFEGSKHQVSRGIHEVLDGNKFLPGIDNQIDFRVVVGKLELSDVVLFFRVET